MDDLISRGRLVHMTQSVPTFEPWLSLQENGTPSMTTVASGLIRPSGQHKSSEEKPAWAALANVSFALAVGIWCCFSELELVVWSQQLFSRLPHWVLALRCTTLVNGVVLDREFSDYTQEWPWACHPGQSHQHTQAQSTHPERPVCTEKQRC